MPRLSRHFSRYFSLSRRSTHPSARPNPKINKSQISKPVILDDEDTTSLVGSPQHLPYSQHTPQHEHEHRQATSPASSTYTTPSPEPAAHREWEDRYCADGLEREIDELLDTYTDMYTNAPTPSHTHPYTPTYFHPPHSSATSPPLDVNIPTHHVPFTPHSTTSIRAGPRQRFENTPPPAPSWEKVSFGRQTRLFGADYGGVEGGRKDWRGEFGRRGYAVL